MLEGSVLLAESAQLLSLRGGKPFTLAGIDLVVPDPPPQGLAGYAEILGHLGDRLPRGAVELDGFPLELRRIVRCWSRHSNSPFRGLLASPTLECPSYRGKPRRSNVTFLVLLGVNPRVAMRRLRHSDVATTLKWYQHARDEL